MRMLDMARPPGPCGGRCPNAVARPGSNVPGCADYRRGMRDVTDAAASSRSHALLVKMSAVGFLKAFRLYRERVDVEIGKASEHGARWWSRRLVEVYEEAGLVRLDK
jgi:hypothetical protein